MSADGKIVIIGTGFAGLGMAIRLKKAGIEGFVVLEQGDDVGGTWRDNHYPGAACDIESHLYSFSFAPNPGWTRTFAPQAEILDYLRRCVDTYGLAPHIRYRTRVVRAAFDEPRGLWKIELAGGETLEARILVAGCGGLSRPSLPDIPGLEHFEGKKFHSARWDHTYPLEGKRVAVIGTGASAVQIVPAIAARVGELHVFQRTAPWIVPKPDHVIPPRTRSLFRRAPIFQQLARQALYWKHESLALGFVVEPRILKLAQGLARRHLRRSVADPSLRRKLTPGYAMGCKRILPSNDYYPAIQRSNVELVTAGIRAVGAHAITTVDGVERPVDALVLATGFHAAEAGAPFEVTGRGGKDLDATWREGAEAYLGTTVSGFPNLFLIVGPNTGLGHSSMVQMIESQVQYILSCIETMRSRGLRSIDVQARAQSEYNARLHARLSRTVWASGCSSWYQTRTGKNTTLWPGFTFEFRARTRRFDPDAYDVVV